MKQNNALVYEVKLKKFLKVTLLGLIITLMFNIISPRHFMSDAVAENDFFNLSDGTYDLVEWEQDGFSYKNPDVSGRMMWVDKKILVVLNKKFDPKEYFIYQGVGDYLIKGSQFGYRYTNSAAFYGDETEIYKGDPTAAYGGGEYRWFNYKISLLGKL